MALVADRAVQVPPRFLQVPVSARSVSKRIFLPQMQEDHLEPIAQKIQTVFTEFLAQEERARQKFNSVEGIVAELVPFINKHRDIIRNFLKTIKGNDLIFGFRTGYITAPLDAIEGMIFLDEGIKGIYHAYEKKDMREATRSILFSLAGLSYMGAGVCWAVSEFAPAATAAVAMPFVVPLYAAVASFLVGYATFSLYFANNFKNELERALPKNFLKNYFELNGFHQKDFSDEECETLMAFLKERITLTAEDIGKIYIKTQKQLEKENTSFPEGREERFIQLLKENIRIAEERKIYRFSKVTCPKAAERAVQVLREHFPVDYVTTLRVPKNYTADQRQALKELGKTLARASKRNIQDQIVITLSHLCWIAVFVTFLAINPPVFSAVFITLWALAVANGVLTSAYNFKTGKYPRIYRLFNTKAAKDEDTELALGARS